MFFANLGRAEFVGHPLPWLDAEFVADGVGDCVGVAAHGFFAFGFNHDSG
jgi:hypothetical protein